MDLLKNMHKNFLERRFLFSFVATLKPLKNMSDVYIARYWLNLDYEQSLFFLGPSSKTPETRKWPRAWLKVGCRPRFSRLATSPLNARARMHSPYKIWRQRETARSLGSILNDNTEQNRMPAEVCVRFFCTLFLSNEAVFPFAYVNHNENRTPVTDQIHF